MDGNSAIRWSLAALVLALVLALVCWAISSMLDSISRASEQECHDRAGAELTVLVDPDGRELEWGKSAIHVFFFAESSLSTPLNWVVPS